MMTSTAFAKINAKSWSKNCVTGADKKESCSIAIIHEVEDKNKKKSTLATAFVVKTQATSKDKKDTKTPVTALVINLPLNVDLTVKPQVQIDGKKLLDLSFTNCNQNDGCKTLSLISDANIEQIKKSKTLSVITRASGSASNIKIDFPLKDFGKEFKNL